MIIGKEVGEKGTPHLQGYVYFKAGRTFAATKKDIGQKAHVETAKGTGEQNREYCTKDGDFIERGEMPKTPAKQGAAGAAFWDNVKELAMEGKIDDIPSKTYVQCFNALQGIMKRHMKKQEPLAHTTGEWWYGPSGSGKSRKARSDYPDAYIKGLNKWWDGYKGEDVVIIEDVDKFNVSMGGDLKRWMDHYSFPAEIKGGGMNIRPKKIIVTSQYSVDEIWEDRATVDAIERRCKLVKFSEK